MSSIFKGSCVALVTPFTETGVNFDALGQLLDWQIAEGTDAILLCGTTGEPSTMTWEERKRVIDFGVKRVAGRGINVIHIEDYLTSVISSEMSATASLELLLSLIHI